MCLDASVGGHVSSGESYDQAFKREAKEELNLDIISCSYVLVAKLTPHEHGISAFMQLYVIYTDLDPEYNTQDFDSAYWFSIQELQGKINNGVLTKGDLPKLIEVTAKYLYYNSRFLINARPEPDLRYFSNSIALNLSSNGI